MPRFYEQRTYEANTLQENFPLTTKDSVELVMRIFKNVIYRNCEELAGFIRSQGNETHFSVPLLNS